MEINYAIRIDHPESGGMLGKCFLDDTEALEAIKSGCFETRYFCDKSDIGDLLDHIKKNNCRTYPVDYRNYNVLIVVNNDYYLIHKLED